MYMTTLIKRCTQRPLAIIALLFFTGIAGQALTQEKVTQEHSFGIAAKKPVLGGACKICPWGAAADMVKEMMKPYGYAVQVCHNCNTAEAPRIVAGAKMPPPIEHSWEREAAIRQHIPKPPAAPVDFGAVGVKFLWDAYRGEGFYANDAEADKKTYSNLRLIGTIQAPTYLIVAVQKELGVTDLAQLKQKKWPLNALVGFGQEANTVLQRYGLSREEITKAGGTVKPAVYARADAEFDLIIGEGTLTTAPEFSFWNRLTQNNDLTYITLPDDLLAQLAEQNERDRVDLPYGLLPGIDRTIPTVAVSGIAIYGREDIPEQFTYDVAKAMDEQQGLLQWAQQNFSYNKHTVWKAYGVPLHTGARRYYREVGYLP